MHVQILSHGYTSCRSLSSCNIHYKSHRCWLFLEGKKSVTPVKLLEETFTSSSETYVPENSQEVVDCYLACAAIPPLDQHLTQTLRLNVIAVLSADGVHDVLYLVVRTRESELSAGDSSVAVS